jgi:hypothetical protein
MGELAKFSAEIDAEDKRSRNVLACKLCETLPGLSVGRREIVQRGLDSAIGAEKLARIFKKNGLDIGRPTILAHRTEGH